MLDYSEMPLNHKKKFFIHDDCGSMYKYIGIISWLRYMGCLGGSVFEGIENLNCQQGYPVVEIEIVTPSDHSAKFIISKNDLYMIAFYAHKWLQFSNCGFTIRDGSGECFTKLATFIGAYTSEPWRHVRPKAMIDAVKFLATTCPKGEMAPCVRSCEAFFIHLCEAVRLYPVESLICSSLAPSTAGIFNKRTYEDEENLLFGTEISVDADVYTFVKAVGPLDFNKTNSTPEHIKDLIKK